MSKAEIPAGLSGYITTNEMEFIAEAWSEYTTSSNPREIATKAAGMLLAPLGEIR